MNWERFNDQFRETSWERESRWRSIKAKRKAEGKCWQCAKLIEICDCPNVKHNLSIKTAQGKSDG
jgi:hypothetical protein